MIARISVQKFMKKKKKWKYGTRSIAISWSRDTRSIFLFALFESNWNFFDRDILDGSCNPLIGLYKDDYVFLIVAYGYVLYLIWSIIGILMLIPGEQRDLSRSPTSPLPACFLHYTLPPTIVSPFPSLRRVDARCRGERHAAFWPARSCSKTSLTCAVRSVLSFDTFPIGLVVACPVRIYRANPDLPPFWSRRRFRLVAKPSAAVLTDRAISRPPIDRTSPGNMFENARSARFYVDPRSRQ